MPRKLLASRPTGPCALSTFVNLILHADALADTAGDAAKLAMMPGQLVCQITAISRVIGQRSAPSGIRLVVNNMRQ